VSTTNHNKKILKKSQEESETEVDTELDINKLQSQFKNLNLNRMTLGNRNDSGIIHRNNKGKYVTHNWYPKPHDLQHEERESGIRTVYTTDVLNIDDLSEYEILNILYEIMMIANVYKDANRSDHQVANSLITYFKRYKDVFLSELLIKMDNRTPYWKEKFIDYFAHKVKEKFNNCHNTSLTYEEIINIIKHIELNFCMINDHLKYMKYAKLELRSFYKQYSFPPLIAPYKKSYKSTKLKHNKKQLVYGQTSNYKNNCEDKIKELNINDKLKFQLLNILSEFDTKSEELLQIDDNNTTSQDEYSESSKDNKIGFCFCKNKNMCSCIKEINTLTREERIILELINQIEDPEIKIKYLSQISQKEKIITGGINYNCTNKFKKEKRPTAGQDLKFEINNIKQEIKE